MAGISYTLLVDQAPASADLLAAIQQIEVEEHVHLADMLRLRIAIGTRTDRSGWTILDDELFSRLTRIRLALAVGSGLAEPLIDAYVIETSVELSNQPGQSVLHVLAMDPSVLMNLEEKVRPWPNMADSDIAATLFGEYSLIPEVEQTQPTRQEVDTTTLQRGTDMQFLRQLAWRNGYECYVETNPTTQQAEGHFHPPRLQQTPQGVLSVSMGEDTNVNSLSLRHNMLQPAVAQVTGLEIASISDQPAQITSQSWTLLGKAPVVGSDRPRRLLLSQTGLSLTGELQTYTQAVVDRSAWAITAEGELNTVAYGGILRAKRLVNLRGAGPLFSGTYYVERVLHALNGDGYTQQFILRRNALGLTGQEDYTTGKALAL